MSDNLIFNHRVLQPSDAEALRAATRLAIILLGPDSVVTGQDRNRVAADIIEIARSGFTRTMNGDFDPRFRGPGCGRTFQGEGASDQLTAGAPGLTRSGETPRGREFSSARRRRFGDLHGILQTHVKRRRRSAYAAQGAGAGASLRNTAFLFRRLGTQRSPA